MKGFMKMDTENSVKCMQKIKHLKPDLAQANFQMDKHVLIVVKDIQVLHA